MRWVFLLVIVLPTACGKSGERLGTGVAGAASGGTTTAAPTAPTAVATTTAAPTGTGSTLSAPVAPVTADPATADPAIADPATADPATADPATADPATPAPAAAPGGCGGACEHRAACGLGDAAACVPECEGMLGNGAIDASGLARYAGLSCDEVRNSETTFQAGAACQKACAHRASCIAGADTRSCIPDCVALVTAGKTGDPAAAMAGYIGADCAQVQAQEPVMACVRGCRHVLACGVAGDLPSCLAACNDELQKGTTLEQLQQVTAMDCATVKRTVQLPGAGGASSGGGSHLCRAEGSYTSCTTGGCATETASATGLNNDVSIARTLAIAKCNSHMQNKVLLAPAGSRAAIRRSCQIASCN